MLQLLFIRKEGSYYVVRSESGKVLGRYKTRGEAEQRLREVEYFKNKRESLETFVKANPRK